MEIRQLDVENYRGIKNLSFKIPKGQKFVSLIGPGDSRKSTILDAISLATTDRWNVSISDTDFYDCNPLNSIRISIVISALSGRLLRDDMLGLSLSGISDEGSLSHDPVDGSEACVIVQLVIDHDLEPMWSVERHGVSTEGRPLSASIRRALGIFKVDERLDIHLRWTRASALSKLSNQDGSTTSIMAEAARAARMAITEMSSQGLEAVSHQVRDRFHAVGGGSFSDIKPGLDTSLSSSGGNLALYDGKVPLTNHGLGTRRLAGLAVQYLASANKAILLIDEIEYGLEPHRLVNFMRKLKDDDDLQQIFVTTHSPIAVEQLSTTDLAVVRANGGTVTASLLDLKSSTTVRLQRSRPSSWLARRIVVVEGKTEEGLLLHLVEHWDKRRLQNGKSTTAGLGVVIQDGQGGSEAPPRALELALRGYETALFLDNDVRTVDRAVRKAAGAGVAVFRWNEPNNTEQQVCAELSAEQLTSLLRLGVSIRRDTDSVKSDLIKAGLPPESPGLNVEDWILIGPLSLDQIRKIVSDATINSTWFKGVDQGRELGEWLVNESPGLSKTSVISVLLSLKKFIYGDDDDDGDDA